MIRSSVFVMATVLMTGITVGQGQSGPKHPPLVLLTIGPGFADHLKASSGQVSLSLSSDAKAPGLNVTIQTGADAYPGISIRPDDAVWNLGKFGHVEARIVNTGKEPLMAALRVDNIGDWSTNPWNTESIQLAPGAAGTISTMFGYSYGHKPGFALKPEAVSNILLFSLKSDHLQSFRIESVLAAGSSGEKPPVAPQDFRLKPASGFLLGNGAPLDLATQVLWDNRLTYLVTSDKKTLLRLLFPSGHPDEAARIKLSFGCWDLSAYSQVQVVLRNSGSQPITARVRVDSNAGSSDWVPVDKPIASGASGTITVSFRSLTPAVLGKAVRGSKVVSDAISAVEIQADGPDADRDLEVESIRAEVPDAAPLPDWVGKRPPVSGEWIKTLDENFDGAKLDSSIWSVYGENYYDKVTHWSKDDVIVGGGVVRLRYEKKLGFHNDDPTRPRSEYAAGYLQTYDKWAQRYGYFEARMKLPKAPGLWPAFWMMPDRGRSKAQDLRSDTGNGGMEFDIMEHLTRWGPFRYNIAMHYDGYGSAHKSLGTDKIYVQPDKDGFITAGLLWTPGSAVYYCNGQEVLRWEDPRISSVPSYFLFTLPSGGWDNNALDDSLLPSEFVIDYVRVWQRKDLASSGDGKKPPAPGSKGQ